MGEFVMEETKTKKNGKKWAALIAVLVVLLAAGLLIGAKVKEHARETTVMLCGDLRKLSDKITLPWDGEDTDPVTQLEAASFLLEYAGMPKEQLGSYPDDYEALAVSMGMLPEDYEADKPCTQAVFLKMQKGEEITALQTAMSAEKKAPLFLNGMAQPIFPYTTGANHEYSNDKSDIIRYCVYVETNHDTDGDGKLDLVKTFIQLPRAAAEGDYKAGVIYEARPYITGCTDNSLEYIDEPVGFDMYASPEPRVSAGSTTTMEAAAAANSADWYYWNPYEDFEGFMDYEDLDWYDYYLARGFAVVECGGLGTRGSEGFETCGSDLEIDAFKCVIEWLTGDRKAYTDLTGNIEIAADWSNGNVGMTGRSYSGTTQMGLAATGVKGLKTIVPVAGIASWYEYTNAQGISTRSELAYTDHLAAFCAGRYLDSEAAVNQAKESGHEEYTSNGNYETIAKSYGRYLNQMKKEQEALNGDYGDHWALRDYTVDTDKIQCSALIVHGLNDFNVRTKQFDLTYKMFQQAGQDVKLLLHQDGHMSPTHGPNRKAFLINGETYDDVINKWFSHYLYGVDNGAENMPAVTAQDSHSDTWTTYDSWDTAANLVLNAKSKQETTVVTSDSIPLNEEEEWEENAISASTAGSAIYTAKLDADTVIKGAPAIHFSAAAGSADGSVAAGKAMSQDALMVSAMLVDIAPEGETFPVFQLDGAYLPKNVIKEKGAWMGSSVENYDLVEQLTTDVPYKVIAKGWMDLCNPGAGYDSASAAQANRIELNAGEFHDYTLYLQPNLYEVKAGHTLALILMANDPDRLEYEKDYTVAFNNASVKAEIPVNAEAAPAALEAEYQPAA